MKAKAPAVTVVGSVNLDIVARVARFPRPGETLTGAKAERHGGGKGANQALAAQRLGVQAALVACVGADAAAEEALARLREEGVNLKHCVTLPGENTGLALILVDDAGENQIVVAPGANAAFHSGPFRLPPGEAVIAQLEIPTDAILSAARQARGLFVLNAAPVKPVPESVLDRTDLLVVNEIEAEALGDSLAGFQGLIATTLGSKGAKLTHKGRIIAEAASPAVEAVDTTGAGDVFTAALTCALVADKPHEEALQWACAAAALSVTRRGAQSGPTAAELLAFLEG